MEVDEKIGWKWMKVDVEVDTESNCNSTQG